MGLNIWVLFNLKSRKKTDLKILLQKDFLKNKLFKKEV